MAGWVRVGSMVIVASPICAGVMPAHFA